MKGVPLPFCANNCGNRCRSYKKKYCSTQCQCSHDFAMRSALLEAGLYPSALAPKWLKKYLIRKLGEKCSKCAWAERHPTTGKVPIEVEHIDGNADNNSLENLTLLCPNCHSLTLFFRNLNRGRGRATRLGGRTNPLRGGEAKGKRLVEPRAPFPLPRSLAALVEPMEPTFDVLPE